MTEPASPDFTSRVAQALLETRSDAILATDRDGIIRFWNPGAERIFGFAAAAAVGQSLDIIIPENLRARHWRGWSHA
ncbi:PAS domain S-box protein, partial [Pseudochelatococcus sp. B33]